MSLILRYLNKSAQLSKISVILESLKKILRTSFKEVFDAPVHRLQKLFVLVAKALACSAAAEMHSGFSALRSQFPMNCRTEKTVAADDAVMKDLQRLAHIWERFEQAEKPDGPFLAGRFSHVDAMFAPVMWRVRNYGLTVSPAFDRWAHAMYALPAMQEWLASARAETWQMPAYER